MNSSDETKSTPFAGGAVREQAVEFPADAGDPYQALDQLMLVAEALCPVWPQRPPFSGTERMLL